MTKSEKRIIDYIANLKTVMIQIHDLWPEITISRFCKKLGYSIYEIYSQDELVSQEINPNDSYKLIAEKLFFFHH